MANPIYAEVVPRELTLAAQEGLVQDAAWCVDENGGLDLPKLLSAFQEFFREHSEHWIPRFDYQEAGPQLLLQAFLQRSMNAVAASNGNTVWAGAAPTSSSSGRWQAGRRDS